MTRSKAETATTPINAGNGNNAVNGNAGNDRMTTGSGNDAIDGGPGDRRPLQRGRGQEHGQELRGSAVP